MPESCGSMGRTEQETAARNTLLQGQRHLCQPNLSPGKVCCLPGAWVLVTMDRLFLRLVAVWPSDCYPQLLFHRGTTDVARSVSGMTTWLGV